VGNGCIPPASCIHNSQPCTAGSGLDVFSDVHDLFAVTEIAELKNVLQIPMHRGHLLRFDRGQATDLMAATIPT
jgi:3-deoxy-D-manno-octulosonic acid (KDO) 8-phosphate synthase